MQKMKKKTLRSIGAILAGMISGAVLSVVTDLVLEKAGIFPSPQPGLFVWWMLLLALILITLPCTWLDGFLVVKLKRGNNKI